MTAGWFGTRRGSTTVDPLKGGDDKSDEIVAAFLS